LKGHSGSVMSVAISQDGSNIVSGSSDETIRMWNLDSRKLLNELKGHSGPVMSVAISQDGTTIVSGAFDQTVRVWCVQNGTCMHILYLNNNIEVIRFNINPNCIVVNNNQVFSISTFTEINSFCELFGTNMNLVVNHWVVKAEKRLFFLPPSFRPKNSKLIVMSDNTITIINNSERMIIISLNPGMCGSISDIRDNIRNKNKIAHYSEIVWD
ncbi:WD40-repeat-containing domain protein, partial [Cyathus striatus]